MKINTKVFKRKSGKSKGKWVVRIRYLDPVEGKKRYVERQRDRRSEVIDLRNQLESDIRKTFGQSSTGERMTFDQLADFAERTFYRPAEIVEGRKVAGVRSLGPILSQMGHLRDFFGIRLLNDITQESLTTYKLHRLKPENKGKEPVKIATVNRELATMRKMMKVAFSKGWLLRDIFVNAKVIEAANEVERSRTLSHNEEARLLDACEGEHLIKYERNRRGKIETVRATVQTGNAHLRAIIMLALDSGLRKGEMLKLRWSDIDFEANSITIIGTHTKTERERVVPLSDRAKKELKELREISPEEPFPFSDFKRSFNTAKKIAGIEDLRFHDLRRTAITRWIKADVPIAIAGKLAGHSQLQTTMKHYTAADEEAIASVKETIDEIAAKNTDQEVISALDN